jgi:hypothetical protein
MTTPSSRAVGRRLGREQVRLAGSDAAAPRLARKVVRCLRWLAVLVGLATLGLGLWIAPWLVVPRLEPIPPTLPHVYHDYPGVLGVHSSYSHDSKGPLPTILQAARDHEFRFVALADHDTFQAARDGWEGWHRNVLLLVGSEITLPNHGYLFVLGVPQADFEGILSLRHGEARPLLDAVARSGGLSTVMYPFLPHGQGWPSWGAASGMTGIEVWNPFGEVEKESLSGHWLTVLRASLVSRISFPAALTAISRRPDGALRQWDSLNRRCRVIAIAGTDAHGRYFPYAQELNSFVTHLVIRQSFSGDAGRDSRLVYTSLRGEHFYFSNDSIYPATGFRFFARQQARTAELGESLGLAGEGPAHLVGEVPYRGAITWRLYRDGQLLWRGKSPAWTMPPRGPAATGWR